MGEETDLPFKIGILILLVFVFMVIFWNLIQEFRTHACEINIIENITKMTNIAEELANGQIDENQYHYYNLPVGWCALNLYVAQEGINQCNAIYIIRTISGSLGTVTATLSCIGDPLGCIGTAGTVEACHEVCLSKLITSVVSLFGEKQYCVYQAFDELSKSNNLVAQLYKPCFDCIKRELGYDTPMVPIVGKYEFTGFGFDKSSGKFDITGSNTYTIEISKKTEQIVTRTCRCRVGAIMQPLDMEAINVDCSTFCGQHNMKYDSTVSEKTSTEEYVEMNNLGPVGVGV